MKVFVFLVVVLLAGCSTGPSPVFEGDQQDKGPVLETMEGLLGENEIVQKIIIEKNPGRKLERPMYIVRASTLEEMRGGRQFHVFYENGHWEAVEDQVRWFSFEPHGRFGCVVLAPQVEIATADAVLEYIRPHLEVEEYVNGINKCSETTFQTNAEGEITGLEKSLVEDCVEVVIRTAGLYKGGRILGVDVQGEEFEIAYRGTIMH